MRNIGGQIVAANFHNLGIVRGDFFAFQHRLRDTDDFGFSVGLTGDGGEGNKGNDCCQDQGQNAEDKTVVQFHKHNLLMQK